MSVTACVNAAVLYDGGDVCVLGWRVKSIEQCMFLSLMLNLVALNNCKTQLNLLLIGFVSYRDDYVRTLRIVLQI